MGIFRLRAIFALALTLAITSLSHADPTSAPGEAAEGVFGEGSGQGAPDSITGAMNYNYPFNLPRARGRPQPQLTLNYNSSTRDREAGYGWGLNLPVIEYRPLSGNPCFTDDGTPISCGEGRRDATGNLLSDERYTFNGQPLVFICRLPGAQSIGDPECGQDETPPIWNESPVWEKGHGWGYYRLQVEGQFTRFYLSKDRKYWRVQLKGGELLEFGQPNGYGTESPRSNPNAILRWRLVRQMDYLHSVSKWPNYVEYRWTKLGKRGLLYLTDIFDTPADSPDKDPDFAHHTQLTWGLPDFPQTSYADAYRATPDWRLTSVAVASKSWSNIGPREVLRTYRLKYATAQDTSPHSDKGFQLWNHSFLKEISMEGQCDKFEDENGNIPLQYCQSPSDKAQGIRHGFVLPSTTFEYKEAEPSFYAASLTGIIGRPPKPFDYTHVLPYVQSVGIVDFNMDGLPDLVQSWNTEYCPGPNAINDLGSYPILFPSQAAPSIQAEGFVTEAFSESLGCAYKGDNGPEYHSFQSTRPITGYLNKGGPPDTAVGLEYQCMDTGEFGETTGLTHYNINRPPGFFTNRGGATLVGRFSEGVVAWGNAQFAPYRAKQLSVIGKTPSTTDWSGGTGCDPDHFVESDFNPRWKWEKLQVGIDWAKSVLSDPDFSLQGSNYGPSPPRWFVDIDGDGLIDRLNRTGQRGTDFDEAYVEFTRRYAKNDPLPGGGLGPAQVPFVIDMSSQSSLAPSTEPQDGHTSFYYVDINGDGLVDLVSYNLTEGTRVRPGDGTGRFACSDTRQPWSCQDYDKNFTTAYRTQFQGPSLKSNLDPYFHDVTGDGLADIIQYDISSGNVFLWVNQDGLTFACVTESCVAGTVKYPPTGDPNIGEYRVTFADMGADGIDDIVILSNRGAYIGSFMSGVDADYFNIQAPRPGLLIRIHNGYGATTDIQYHTIQQLDVAAKDTDSAWRYHSSVVQNVVTRVITSDVYSAGTESATHLGKPYTFRYDTKYFYSDPAYDRWSNSFVGFRRVGVQQGDEKAATSTTYWFGPCQNNELGFRLDSAPDIPLCQEGSDDEDYKSLSGRIVRIDRGGLDLWFSGLVPDQLAKARGIPHVPETRLLWTKIFDYKTDELFDRDRRVTFTYPAQTHTYLYDDAQPVLTDGVQTQLGGDEQLQPFRQPGVRKHLRSSVKYDNRGTVRKITAEGSIIDEDSNPGEVADPATVTLFSRNDPSGPDDDSLPLLCTSDWQCLPKFVSVWNPKVPFSPPLRKMRYGYTPAGDIASVEGWLEEEMPLERRHAKSGALFSKNAPGQYLKRGWYTLALLDYDSIGNLIQKIDGVSAPGVYLNCTEYIYDHPFSQFLGQVWRLNSECGGKPLITQMVFHRGLEKVVKSTSPNGYFTQVSLDPFGRPLQIYLPNPDSFLEEPVLAATIAYRDMSPLSLVDMQSLLGPVSGTRSVSILNGLRRSVLNFDLEADNKWVLSGWGERNASGQVISANRPWFFTGDPVEVASQATLIQVPPESLTFGLNYDGFGRPVSFWKGNTDSEILRNIYFPLAIETRDTEQLKAAGPHGKAFTRSETDGSGRTIRNLTHIEYPAVENIITTAEYLPTGEPSTIRRTYAGGTYQRIMKYDNLGRLVLNMEPNTGNNWRYVWDNAGRLIGTSDARGCGTNYYYDGFNRVVGEDYSPCLESHPIYTAPNPKTGAGLEVFYQYDAYESGQVNPEPGFNDDPVFALGNLVSVQDRGSHTRFNYDARDRVRRISRQIATPAGGHSTYAPHWFITRMDYALDNQLVRRTTGVDIKDLLMNGTSEERYTYLQNQRLQGIDSSYGTIIKDISYDVEGAPTRITYGDSLGTKATFAYDELRRLRQYKLSNPLSPFSGTIFDKWASIGHFDYSYSYDDVGNPLSIVDESHPLSFRNFPAQAIPVLRRDMKYDDLYRLTSIDYSYRQSSNINWDGSGDPWQSPFEAEAKANDLRPIPQRELATRTAKQTFQYDGMGNITASDDDLKARYDRSLGSGLGYGTALDGPNQLRTGEGLNVSYDAAGNLSELKIERSGKCLGVQTNRCAQWFTYDWDEVGQLARARRWDFDGNKLPLTASPTGSSSKKPSWDISYSYSQGSRVRKSAANAADLTTHNLEIFDTLRIERTAFNAAAGNYQVKPDNLHAYVGGIGHALWDGSNTLSHQSPDSRIVMHLIIGDHLGSSSVMINHATSNLVERTAYQPYGAVESDYRQQMWNEFREPYKFTGKEEDIEVGVTYFGARYYQPNLGRFMSADPLTIHALGSNLNPYAYVAGRVMTHIDPFGLGDEPPPGCIGECADKYFNDMAARKAAEEAKAIAAAPLPPSMPPTDPTPTPPDPAPTPPASVPSTGTIPYEPTKDMNFIDRWIVGGSSGFHDAITSDRNLAAVQTGLTYVSAAAATFATGGLALELAAGWTAEGIGAAAMVNMSRAAMALTEWSLAEQGIIVGGGGGGALAIADETGALFSTRYAGRIGPGPFAGSRIAAKGSGYASKAVRQLINAIMKKEGCHTCGTKIGKSIADHQPPNGLNPTGGPQWFFPQCEGCSPRQGNEVKGLLGKD